MEIERLVCEEKRFQNIERKSKGKVIVIFAHPPKSVFHMTIVDSFAIGSS